MIERMQFVARLQAGERMTDLCREFGVSRQTGYELRAKFEEFGLEAFEDQKTAPKRIPHRTSLEIRALFVEAKKKHSTWGPRKLRAWLLAKKPALVLPSANTIGYWLRREGLVAARGKRQRSEPTAPNQLTKPKGPNDVWGVDFKGQFRLGSGRLCYPLTITDLYSRSLLGCVALDGTSGGPARIAFEEVFREYGLPKLIRTDNGSPFASIGLAGLTPLSVWWLRLGIELERIEPAHPEQNGQHERMHLTLKRETTRPAGANMLQQQERFDRFREEFNEERPHEALGLRPPASAYEASPRRFPDALIELDYPLHDLTCEITSGGAACLNGRQFFLSLALRGERVGLREIDDGTWLVSFMKLDLGHFDERTRKFERKLGS
jgi:transposase InsO family protein